MSEGKLTWSTCNADEAEILSQPRFLGDDKGTSSETILPMSPATLQSPMRSLSHENSSSFMKSLSRNPSELNSLDCRDLRVYSESKNNTFTVTDKQGKKYSFIVTSSEECDTWVRKIRMASRACQLDDISLVEKKFMPIDFVQICESLFEDAFHITG